ncbi:MAG: Gfo/Idh/MocA family oxidoreductase [Planctomycetota bacterium]|nr:Gfo/Idh/MocA family oxidoreductase [Planctomycetota bacterium]
MPDQHPLDRRSLIAAGAVAAVTTPWLMTRSGLAGPSTSANETIGIGVIGLGIRGRRLMSQLMERDDVRIVGVSEVAGPRLLAAMQAVEAKDGEPCPGYLDYEDLLSRPDIDAVVIATQDHAHTRPAVLAARNGIDVYCEKPLTLTIAEGQAIRDAVRDGNAVFQTGSQQRSEYGGKFRVACEHIRNGRIGQLKTVEVGVGDPPTPCDLPDEDTPAGYDWERWLGSAPQRGFNAELCPVGVHGHYPRWRQYREYGNGYFADMGAHHYDIAQWAMDTDHTGPIRIIPPDRVEGEMPKHGLILEYDNGVSVSHGGRNGCTFTGTEGMIYVDRGALEASDEAILKDPAAAGDLKLPETGGHMKNWMDCIRSRNKPICHEEVGHRTASVCQLAVIGYEVGEPLTWDPKAEIFTGSNASIANAKCARQARGQWGMPSA